MRNERWTSSRAVDAGRDLLHLDERLRPRGELALDRLRDLAEPGEHREVERQVDPVLLEEDRDHVGDHAVVDVVAAEVGVPGRREHLEDLVVDLEDGGVEGAAAEVVDDDPRVHPLPVAVGEGRGGGLVDDPEHLETGDLPGVAGRLPLGVVEVRGDGDDRPRHLLPRVGRGEVPEVAEDEREDLGDRVGLAAGHDERLLVVALDDLEGGPLERGLDGRREEGAPDEALRRVDRVGGVDGAPPHGVLADEDGARRVERDDRGVDPPPVGVRDHVRLVSVDDGDHRVRCSEIDSDDALAHPVASKKTGS
jgi:hypothetical protein